MPLYAVVKAGEITGYRSTAPNVDQSTLAEGKPRILPVEVENEEFDPITEVRTGPEMIVESIRVRKVYTVRDKSEDEIAAMKAAKVSAIKAEAQKRILAIMPAYQQTNWLAKGMEMSMVHGPDPASWPVEQQQAANVVLTKWAQIEAIRARSNEVEADVLALTDPADVHAFDTEGWEID